MKKEKKEKTYCTMRSVWDVSRVMHVVRCATVAGEPSPLRDSQRHAARGIGGLCSLSIGNDDDGRADATELHKRYSFRGIKPPDERCCSAITIPANEQGDRYARPEGTSAYSGDAKGRHAPPCALPDPAATGRPFPGQPRGHHLLLFLEEEKEALTQRRYQCVSSRSVGAAPSTRCRPPSLPRRLSILGPVGGEKGQPSEKRALR